MGDAMKDQWNAIANENAFYGVLSLPQFENPDGIDLEKFWESGRRDVDLVAKKIGHCSTRDLSIVEIGCGLGRMTHAFAARYQHVFAIDISEQMIRRATAYWANIDNITWSVGNGKDLCPIANNSQDFVFSYMVLQHIPDPEIVLNYINESARVLREGGTAFLQFRTQPDGPSLTGIKNFLSTRYRTIYNVIRGSCNFLTNNEDLKAKFARQYQAWCGCHLKHSVIEHRALAVGLKIQKRERLGIQYSSYIFTKFGEKIPPLGSSFSQGS